MRRRTRALQPIFNADILWKLGVVMAVCNLLGAVTGSRLALRDGGAGFVRRVVTALIVKLAFDHFRFT